LSSFPFVCANCSVVITEAKAYCSQGRTQEARWVRYVRRCRSDGRAERPDVVEAIRIRLAQILAGGYEKLARRLSASVRKAVFERDEAKCRRCGQPGSEIDHISGSSS